MRTQTVTCKKCGEKIETRNVKNAIREHSEEHGRKLKRGDFRITSATVKVEA